MGRIKSALIKRTAEQLISRFEFQNTFEANKKILSNVMPSKRLRNKIAGYITRLEKAKRKENRNT